MAAEVALRQPTWFELGEELLAHLAGQIGSAERMLAVVVEQGAAIRARDVRGVVRTLGLLQGELMRREELEQRRQGLLERAAEQLGVGPAEVTVQRLCEHLEADQGRQVAARSAQLRGLIEQLGREHAVNRALMRVELAFLDHLLSHLEPSQPPTAYDTRGATAPTVSSSDIHVLDMEA